MGSPGPAFHKWAEVPAAAGFLDGAGVGRDHEPRGWHAWRWGRPRRSRGGCSRRPEFLGLEASRAETVSGGPADDDHGPPGQGTPRAAPPSRVNDPGHPVKPGAAHGGRRRRCRRRPETDWVYQASGRATVLRRPHRLRPAIQAIRSSGQGRPNWCALVAAARPQPGRNLFASGRATFAGVLDPQVRGGATRRPRSPGQPIVAARREKTPRGGPSG